MRNVSSSQALATNKEVQVLMSRARDLAPPVVAVTYSTSVFFSPALFALL
jgi:hypothetical protein